MGAARSGSMMGVYVVFPARVLVRKAMPPERRGISCATARSAVSESAAASIAYFRLRVIGMVIGADIPVTVAACTHPRVLRSSALCQWIVTRRELAVIIRRAGLGLLVQTARDKVVTIL